LKFGKIDQNDRVGFAARGFRFSKCESAPEHRQSAGDFRQTDNRKIVGRDDCFDSGFAQLRAGRAEKFKFVSGAASRKARTNFAACASPDASPATIKILHLSFFINVF
jgi:hypothetical protein